LGQIYFPIMVKIDLNQLHLLWLIAAIETQCRAMMA
jgi:hypothetical protein